jgi:hypothetical protein
LRLNPGPVRGLDEDDVWLALFASPQTDFIARDDDQTQLASPDDAFERTENKLQDQLMKDCRRRQEFQKTMGILDAVIVIEFEILLFAPLPLGGEKPSDLPGQFGLSGGPERLASGLSQFRRHV